VTPGPAPSVAGRRTTPGNTISSGTRRSTWRELSFHATSAGRQVGRRTACTSTRRRCMARWRSATTTTVAFAEKEVGAGRDWRAIATSITSPVRTSSPLGVGTYWETDLGGRRYRVVWEKVPGCMGEGPGLYGRRYRTGFWESGKGETVPHPAWCARPSS
jgi:hypothetical protein